MKRSRMRADRLAARIDGGLAALVYIYASLFFDALTADFDSIAHKHFNLISKNTNVFGTNMRDVGSRGPVAA